MNLLSDKLKTMDQSLIINLIRDTRINKYLDISKTRNEYYIEVNIKESDFEERMAID